MSAPDASGLREAARTTSHGDVEEFNRDCPIGTAVLAFPGSRDGRALMTRTRSTAWLVGREPVVMVEGYAGGIALTHIEVVPATPPADDASEGLSEAIGMSLYESLMEASADQWRRWEFLTDAAKETYRAEAARIVATAVEPVVAARVSAAATRARAEGAAEALREAADILGAGPTMRWLYERESCDWWGDRPVRDWLRDRADRIARGGAAPGAGGRP